MKIKAEALFASLVFIVLAPIVIAAEGAGSTSSPQVAGLRIIPRFTDPLLECASPCWSPDGKYVMFVARGGIVSKGLGNSGVLPGNVWVTDGSKRWLVSKFFFGMIRPPDGYRADPLKLDVGAVSWSPEGGKIAFFASGDLYVMKADATDIFLVTSTDCTIHSLLQWTPDGKSLLFNTSHGMPTMTDLEGTKSQS